MASLFYAIAVIFAAAIVRGFSGFGFSLLAISALSLAYAPADIVPSIFLMEIVASLNLLISSWRDVHWRSLGPLIAGCLVATPFGVWALAHFAAAPMQLALGLFVLAAVVLMARGAVLKAMPGRTASFVAGAASGLANGAFGMAGPPAVLFYFSSPAGHAAGRASLIAFFLATDLIGLANMAPHGLLTREVFVRAAAFLPPLIAGVWIGQKLFTRAAPEKFRKAVLLLLAFIALATVAKSAAALWL
jgi:uncharacterized membrane protein YfcA